MEFPVINTRADLDAIAGTPAYDTFMQMLAGSLWRLEKDDALQSWALHEDNTTIERFGFTRADFPDAAPPELPPPPAPPPIPSTVSMYQARIALHQAGLLATVEAGITQMSEEAQIKWEFAPTVKRNDDLALALASALNLSESQLDDLFTAAAGIV